MSPEYIIAAFVLDMLFGDPRAVPHPVQAIGLLISMAERLARRIAVTPAGLRIAGAVMTLFVCAVSYAVPALAVYAAYRYIGHAGGVAVTVYLAYTTISAKSLAEAARAVMQPLAAGDLPGARGALSMVVGRDTQGLSEPDIARGAVETVAENSSDGVVAPLLYMAVGGVPLAFMYKAINTMDSMAGYKSDRFIDFGRASARLDDVANFIPARLTGILAVAAAALLSATGAAGYSPDGAWAVFVRDRKNHASPNSGHPEAAMAGALGVRLGGESSYFGVGSVKPYIGDKVSELGPDKIADAVRLMLATAVLAVVFCYAIAAVAYR